MMDKIETPEEGELVKVLKELAIQKEENEKLSAKLLIASNELAFELKEKGKRAAELNIANKNLIYQNNEKEKRAAELSINNKELIFQNEEKEKRANELIIANKELAFQNDEKEKRANELIIANHELAYQNDERQKRANEQTIANKELAYQNDEKVKRAAELFIANEELLFETEEKEKRAAELVIANIELDFQNQEREKREITNKELIEAKIKAEKATQIAEVAVKAKQQFLSTMSHEIRTPMNAIIGFTKVMLKTNLTVKQEEYLNAIKISGDALIVLINDILNLAKLEAGKMSFEKTPFKLAASISSMLHLFETKIEEKNLKLIKDYDSNIPEVLLGDPIRLHQIILNLLSNAVKFTKSGIITVKVCQIESIDPDNISIQFSVTDTGIGIEEHKQGYIFESFQQASSSTARLFGGTGLGLAIAKQLVQQQGGTIGLKSKINEGSTFSFILNFEKACVIPAVASEFVELDHEIKNLKVLVVEDIPLNQLLMKTFLDDFGFECHIAMNGIEAIEKLSDQINHATKPFDIILMDLQMPEMNGFEATAYIRNKMNTSIPIIALTADVTTVDLEKCKAVGMNDYIPKPVDERILYSKMIEYVKKTESQTTKDDEQGIFVDKGEVYQMPDKKKRILKYVNLDYLKQRTKSNKKLMTEMISLYLDQTPPLLVSIRQSLKHKDWSLLGAAIHKLIPSFAIMGISTEFELMAKKIQELSYLCSNAEIAINERVKLTAIQTNTNLLGNMEIHELSIQLEKVCWQACKELIKELKVIKNCK